jgi:energy-coupling factor transport system substrate-specific component
MTAWKTADKKLPALAAAIILGGLGNALLSYANMAISSPFFFDSIFTAVCAALFGPLAGSLCALVSHVFMESLHGWGGLFMPFVLCNIATALIVGSFAKKRRFSTPIHAMICAIAVTLANAVLGAFIAYFVFGGVTGHTSDFLVTGLILAGQSLLAASFWARIPANLIDKSVAVGIAYAVAAIYGRRRAILDEGGTSSP